MSYFTDLEAYLPKAVLDHRWLFGGLAAGAVGLGCVYLIRKWAAGGVCRSQARLDGKTVIITGGNSGIGLETAVDLAKRNARVILACRSVEKGEKAVTDVKKRSGNNNVVFLQLDLSSLDSVREFAGKILEQQAQQIDILVNNAGVMMIPERRLTKDGFEMQFGTNHLGHFLLTNLLLDCLKKAPSARIVNVSSIAYRRGVIDINDLNSEQSYAPIAAYCKSKLANILFTRGLAKRLQGTNVTANAVHPGGIRTGLQQHSKLLQILYYPTFFIWKTPWEGAQTSIYCAVSEEMEGVSGQYLADCKIQTPVNRQATDDQLADQLWEASAKMVGLQ